MDRQSVNNGMKSPASCFKCSPFGKTKRISFANFLDDYEKVFRIENTGSSACTLCANSATTQYQSVRVRSIAVWLTFEFIATFRFQPVQLNLLLFVGFFDVFLLAKTSFEWHFMVKLIYLLLL